MAVPTYHSAVEVEKTGTVGEIYMARVEEQIYALRFTI
jgi:hypothetical protein